MRSLEAPEERPKGAFAACFRTADRLRLIGCLFSDCTRMLIGSSRACPYTFTVHFEEILALDHVERFILASMKVRRWATLGGVKISFGWSTKPRFESMKQKSKYTLCVLPRSNTCKGRRNRASKSILHLPICQST